MDDAAPVRGVERLGDLPGKVQHPRGGERTFLDQLLDGPAFEQLHRDERLAAVFAELVNRRRCADAEEASFASRSNRPATRSR